jgi:hypothetical protein
MTGGAFSKPPTVISWPAKASKIAVITALAASGLSFRD